MSTNSQEFQRNKVEGIEQCRGKLQEKNRRERVSPPKDRRTSNSSVHRLLCKKTSVVAQGDYGVERRQMGSKRRRQSNSEKNKGDSSKRKGLKGDKKEERDDFQKTAVFELTHTLRHTTIGQEDNVNKNEGIHTKGKRITHRDISFFLYKKVIPRR